jgi:riboflavin synthase
MVFACSCARLGRPEPRTRYTETMFTGIIQAVGTIDETIAQSLVRDPSPDHAWTDAQGLRLLVSWGGLDFTDVKEGDSIAINGACMTVLRPDEQGFAVDISRESLDRTVGLDGPGPVNLEKALRWSDRLGGHLVSGHIDAVATAVAIEPRDESVRLTVRVPASLGPFVTEKGSVALHGVSLTINQLRDHAEGTDIEINLIPHTWQSTTLSRLEVGGGVNLEVDPMARQMARIIERMGSLQRAKQDV